MKRILGLLVAVMTGLAAWAAVTDFGNMEANKIYALEAFSDGFTGFYANEFAGLFVIEVYGEKPNIYSDAEGNKPIDFKLESGGSLGWRMVFEASAGQIIYIRHGFMAQSMKLQLIPPDKAAVDGVKADEQPGKYYNLQGVEMPETARGLLIRNGQKIYK